MSFQFDQTVQRKNQNSETKLYLKNEYFTKNFTKITIIYTKTTNIFENHNQTEKGFFFAYFIIFRGTWRDSSLKATVNNMDLDDFTYRFNNYSYTTLPYRFIKAVSFHLIKRFD